MTQDQLQSGRDLVAQNEAVEAAHWRHWKREGCQASRKRLLDRYVPWAKRIARSQFRRLKPAGVDVDDVIQLAYLGLLEAMERFEPDRDAAFIGFAHPRLIGAVRDGLSNSNDDRAAHFGKRRLEAERIRSVLGRIDDKERPPLDQLRTVVCDLALGVLAKRGIAAPTPSQARHEDYEFRELCISVVQGIEKMDDPDRFVMQHHYFNDVPLGTLAQSLDLSRSKVSQIHARSLKRLRNELGVRTKDRP